MSSWDVVGLATLTCHVERRQQLDAGSSSSLVQVVDATSSTITDVVQVFVWGFGVLFVCVCVSVSGVLFSVLWKALAALFGQRCGDLCVCVGR